MKSSPKNSNPNSRRIGRSDTDFLGLFENSESLEESTVDLLAPAGETPISVALPGGTKVRSSKAFATGLTRPERAGTAGLTILTVSQLTQQIRNSVESDVGEKWVKGEISNLQEAQSGHKYFTLKDERAQISCVLFKGRQAASVQIANGKKVALYGRVTLYEERGQLQIQVEKISLSGEGDLQAKFEELKNRLKEEGMFDSKRKRPLPWVPRVIGVVTSLKGAALRDILQVLERRAPHVQVVIAPVRVQGDGAAIEIAGAIQRFSHWSKCGFLQTDVLIVGRGGGSIEDLWAFNEESVARAIFSCSIPVISAVGHETDYTIADFVADLRAATPTAAAELAARAKDELLERLHTLCKALGRETSRTLADAAGRLATIRNGATLNEPKHRLAEATQTLDHYATLVRLHTNRQVGKSSERLHDLHESLKRFRPSEIVTRYGERILKHAAYLSLLIERSLEDKQRALETKAAALNLAGPDAHVQRYSKQLTNLVERVTRQMSGALDNRAFMIAALSERVRLLGPMNTLARGYSITRPYGQKEILRHPHQAPPGTFLETLFADGRLISTVIPDKPQNSLSPQQSNP